MKRVALLALDGAVSASVSDPTILLNGVNDMLTQNGRDPLFDVQLVGLKKAVRLHSGVFTAHADIKA